MNEQVTVCIPTYNGEQYIREAVMSVLNQTYHGLEVLVVDDGSIDGTVEILQDLQRRDPRIKIFQNTKNLGLAANWNRCLELAKGEWIKYHFQDDLMAPSAIAEMMHLAAKRNCRIVLSDREYLTSNDNRAAFYSRLTTLSQMNNGMELITPNHMAVFLLKNQLRENFLGEPIVGLFHRSVTKDHGGFNLRYSQIVDFEFWLRLALAEPIGFVRQKLVTFRVHDQSTSSANKRKKGISPSLTDRIALAEAMMLAPEYQSLEKLVGTQVRNRFVKQVLIVNLRKIGLFKILLFGKWSLLRYYFKWPWALLICQKQRID